MKNLVEAREREAEKVFINGADRLSKTLRKNRNRPLGTLLSSFSYQGLLTGNVARELKTIQEKMVCWPSQHCPG